ncbi:MAG TPA: hypothetical protein DDY31_11465, partial [Lachnospiraceae bacterium]|nr:hypothetical protein [Lachnospiraceae bacterium]
MKSIYNYGQEGRKYMAEKDLASKKIEDYNEVFADIYNTLLFRSPVITPEQLQSGPTESIYKADNGNL